MKIAEVRTHVLAAPLPAPIRMAHGTMRVRPGLLVEVVTTDGLSGWGESWVNFPPWAWRERVATVGEGLRPLLLGRDPLDREALWAEMYRALVPLARQWGAVGPAMQAISGVDIALWDLAGRAAGQPVRALLGARAPARIPVYASGLGPPDAAAAAVRAVEAGFRAVKLKLGFGRETDRRLLSAVRQAIGDDVALLVDANQAWSPEEALEMAPFLADYGVRWLEEPVPSADETELARVAGRVGVPLAAGENVYGRCGFARVLAAGVVDVVQPDVTKTGGISEVREVCALAAAHGRPWAPHFYGGALGAAATLHCFAAFAGGLMVEWDWNPNALLTDLVEGGFDVREGTVALPEGPGLGVEVRPDALRRFAVSP